MANGQVLMQKVNGHNIYYKDRIEEFMNVLHEQFKDDPLIEERAKNIIELYKEKISGLAFGTEKPLTTTSVMSKLTENQIEKMLLNTGVSFDELAKMNGLSVQALLDKNRWFHNLDDAIAQSRKQGNLKRHYDMYYVSEDGRIFGFIFGYHSENMLTELFL